MFKTSIVLLVMPVILSITLIITSFYVDAKYTRGYKCHWNLADKSSTIATKQEKIRAFVDAIEEGNSKGEFSSHNAIFFTTPDNELLSNLKMLKTLDQRLSEIREMDVKSFEYNTAIQQITAQEQGEAHKMTVIFEGCWVLKNYPFLWEWIRVTVVIFLTVSFVAGLVLLIEYKSRI